MRKPCREFARYVQHIIEVGRPFKLPIRTGSSPCYVDRFPSGVIIAETLVAAMSTTGHHHELRFTAEAIELIVGQVISSLFPIPYVIMQP